ncbi:ATP-binding protein [Brotaphodocola sp.]|uniref:ATP-binding protein n=1 Tax=Brotaphodocola sp. TaxID=3073577 RepID=UPI003D7E5E81
MTKFLDRLICLALYGGLQKEQYRQIAPELDEANRKSLVILSASCAFFYLIRIKLFNAHILTLNKTLFLTAAILFGILAVCNCLRLVRSRSFLIHCCAYLFLIIYLGIGIFSAIGPESIKERTTLYLVFVTAAPMMFALNAAELATIMVPAELLYLFLIAKYQSAYPVYLTNQSNSIFFSISGLLLGIYTSDMKVSGIYNAYMNSRMEEIKKLNDDLTRSRADLEKALADAEHSNRAKTIFLNNMSHDIRTPMNAIIGFSSLAAANADNPKRVRNYLEKISISGHHLLSLINDILDMSRIESGKMRLTEKPVHLPDLLKNIQTMICVDLEAKHLQFFTDFSSIKHENILADELRLNQILINILSNAIKFTPAGGSIWFTINEIDESDRQTDGKTGYRFVIRDTGIGMSREFQKHIFETFSREESVAVNNIQGTGLGMAITKNIVDMMNGKISVQSEEGKGSEFTVSLQFSISESNAGTSPASSVSPAARSESSDTAPAHPQDAKPSEMPADSSLFAGKTILLVEDNELNQEIATTILTDSGFKVELAGNGAAAVRKVQTCADGHYALILMDIQMPIMDGYEATKKIRALSDPAKSQIPILAMTANVFEEDKNRALEAGMNGHLSKPIDVSRLFEELHKIFCK